MFMRFPLILRKTQKERRNLFHLQTLAPEGIVAVVMDPEPGQAAETARERVQERDPESVREQAPEVVAETEPVSGREIQSGPKY